MLRCVFLDLFLIGWIGWEWLNSSCSQKLAIYKNNTFVTVNNDFWVTREAICQWFSRVTNFWVTREAICQWRSHQWKSLANRLTSDQKIVIHGNECIILFLTRYFMSWTHSYRSLISPLSIRTAFSDLVLWRYHSWSVTSHERTALALWRHIRRLLLHAQFGAKAIFTSE